VLDAAQDTSLRDNPNALVVIVAVIIAGLVLNWFQRKYLKKMAGVKRIYFIGVGALVLGGVFYAMVYNR
jgi:hypothetical protein